MVTNSEWRSKYSTSKLPCKQGCTIDEEELKLFVVDCLDELGLPDGYSEFSVVDEEGNVTLPDGSTAPAVDGEGEPIGAGEPVLSIFDGDGNYLGSKLCDTGIDDVQLKGFISDCLAELGITAPDGFSQFGVVDEEGNVTLPDGSTAPAVDGLGEPIEAGELVLSVYDGEGNYLGSKPCATAGADGFSEFGIVNEDGTITLPDGTTVDAVDGQGNPVPAGEPVLNVFAADGTYIGSKVCPSTIVVCSGAETAPYIGQPLLIRAHISQAYVSPLGGAYRGTPCDCGVPIVKCEDTNRLKGPPEHDRICFIANSGAISGGNLTAIPVGNTVVAESALISVTNTTCRIFRGLRRVEGRVRVSTTEGPTQVIQNQQISINGGNYSSAENDLVSNLDGQNIQLALVADRLSCQTNVLPDAVVSLQSRLNLNVLGPNGVEWSDSESSALLDLSTTRS